MLGQWADNHPEMFGKSSQKESGREDILFFSLSSAAFRKQALPPSSVAGPTELYVKRNEKRYLLNISLYVLLV